MSTGTIQILLAADDASTAISIYDRLVHIADETGMPVRIVTSLSADQALVSDSNWDLVIAPEAMLATVPMDHSLPATMTTPRILLIHSNDPVDFNDDSLTFDRWSAAESASPDFAQRIHRVLMLARCMRLRRDAEAAAQRYAEQFRFALETARMKMWSTAYPARLAPGQSPVLHSVDIVRSNFPGILSTDVSALAAALTKAITDREAFSAEFRVTRPDGSIGWALAKGRVVVNSAGDPVAIAGVELDITDRKLLEEQLRRAQRMETIGQLAGGVAHDFNNLITAIFGHVAMATEQLPADHPVLRSLNAIEHVAQQGNRVTRGLLSFSKHSVGDKRLVDLCRIVDEAVRLARPIMPASIRMSVHAPREEPVWILADDAQLQQVILNIAVNARDAMPEGGELEMTVAARAEQASATAPAFAALRISDTGIGIAPDVQERIFDPFFTTKDRTYGTGLGLSIVHGIISEHGGRIQVRSSPGRGSTFEILLPRAAAVATSMRSVSPATRSSPRGNGELILVAEDHEQIRELIGATLRSLGYQVSLSANGEEFLDAFRLRRAQARLALVDADLPKCTGVECVRQLRASADRLPVIIATGAVDVPVDDLADDVTVILRKPYRMQTLAEHVAALVNGKTQLGGESQ